MCRILRFSKIIETFESVTRSLCFWRLPQTFSPQKTSVVWDKGRDEFIRLRVRGLRGGCVNEIGGFANSFTAEELSQSKVCQMISRGLTHSWRDVFLGRETMQKCWDYPSRMWTDSRTESVDLCPLFLRTESRLRLPVPGEGVLVCCLSSQNMTHSVFEFEFS